MYRAGRASPDASVCDEAEKNPNSLRHPPDLDGKTSLGVLIHQSSIFYIRWNSAEEEETP